MIGKLKDKIENDIVEYLEQNALIGLIVTVIIYFMKSKNVTDDKVKSITKKVKG